MLSPNFSPFPELTTDRLVLRKMTHEDAEAVFRLRSNEEVMKYICRPLTKTMDEALKWVDVILDALHKNEGITWGISLTDRPSYHIGSIGFWRLQKENYRAEIGYMLDPAYHSKGLMYEAMQAVLQYGFGPMQLHSVEAHVAPENRASIALLEKAGFVREAHFKENFFFEGKFLDTVIYSILAKSQQSLLQ